MSACPSCQATLAASDKFCPRCGASRDDTSGVTMTTPGMRVTGGVSRTVIAGGHDAIDHGALAPGATLAGRYRILSLIGRGGMGEVYRADDLTLAQPVALKFLPASLDNDPSRLQRFLQEVRLSRQISHPNVCRVYDVAEADGRHFLSMEFVDGEDLASLLRRIGRLPSDKAIEITRQLCAGLAAAHEKGVLHRDLKPANVMLDGRGKVRLTDFGLAQIEATGSAGEMAGTPAYMAPEQLDGQPATVRSDIYALGLVMHEIFSGKRVFDATTLEGLRRQHRDSSSRSLSSTVRDIDPAVERIIDRCLDRDPARRPASALAVAAALPGGDPLAAALAAGETPSPELVAAAGRADGLRPALAIASLLVLLAAIATVGWLTSSTMLYKRVTLTRSIDALEDRAREIIQRLGYTEPPADSAAYVTHDPFYLRYIAATDRSATRWQGLETTPTLFMIYRQSPRELIALVPGGRVGGTVPPEDVSGMASAWVDRQGRLVVFSAQPPQFVESPDEALEADWAAVFAEARLDMSRFTAVRPKWVPPMAFDSRVAWEGEYPSTPAVPVHIEAASFLGKPVYFNIRGPWDVPIRQSVPQPTLGNRIEQGLLLALLLALSSAAVLLARRNARARRGDARGAARIAAIVYGVLMLSWIVGADHSSNVPSEMTLLIIALGGNGLIAAAVWIVYMALEPFVRRRWPHTLVGWTRALAGRVSDPQVGRELLFGAAAGAIVAALAHAQQLAPAWLGQPPPTPGGVVPAFANVVGQVGLGIFQALFGLFLLLVLRMVLRRDWIATIALAAMAALTLLGQSQWSALGAALAIASASLMVTVLRRLGLLALTALTIVADMLATTPFTLDAAAWYAPVGFTALAMVAAIGGWGFYAALAGQPLFGHLLDD
jgi:serine/threonine-protein kinase